LALLCRQQTKFHKLKVINEYQSVEPQDGQDYTTGKNGVSCPSFFVSFEKAVLAVMKTKGVIYVQPYSHTQRSPLPLTTSIRLPRLASKPRNDGCVIFRSQ